MTTGTIVVGYDGQDGSKAALQTATELAAALSQQLVIVFAYAPAAIGGQVADLARAVEELGEQMTAEALQSVQRIDATVDAKVELVNDRPADGLLRAADAYDAWAIVIGASNRGPVRGGLLGSVCYQVVHRADRRVVVVPTDLEAAAGI